LTGEESEAGMTYINSQRVWSSPKARKMAARGELTHEEIIRLAPRQLLPPETLAAEASSMAK
jgi:hypothetical protein